MKHIIVCDSSNQEFWKIVDGVKTASIFSSNAERTKYQKAKVGEEVYFLESNGRGILKAKAVITNVIKVAHDFENYQSIIEEFLPKLSITKTQLKNIGAKDTVYLIEYADFELISPIVYINHLKLRDFASFKDFDDELFKKVRK